MHDDESDTYNGIDINQTTPTEPPDKPEVYRMPQVIEITGLSRSTIHRLRATGDFPEPVDLTNSGRAIGFLAHEVRGWIQTRRRTRN